MQSPTCSVQTDEPDLDATWMHLLYCTYDESCRYCGGSPSLYPDSRIRHSYLDAAPDYIRLSRDPTSKDAHLSHLTRARERHTLSRRQHQSEKLQSLEFRGHVRRPPRLAIKGTRTDIWRENYVNASLIVQPRRCRCDWCLRLEGPVRERDRDLLWAARRAEKGKDWKGRTVGGNSTRGQKLPNWVDYDWDVAYDDVDADTFWDEAENAFEVEARVIEVDLLDQATKSYPRQQRHSKEERRTLMNMPSSKAPIGTTESSANDYLNPCEDQEWELMTLQSEWDQCSVQSL